MIGIRKGLYHTMIGNGDCLMPPLQGSFYICLDIHNRVHLTHLCMGMKLYTLSSLIMIHTIHPGIVTRFHSTHRSNADLMAEFISEGHSLYNHKFIFLELTAVLNLRMLLRLHKDLH